MLKKHIRVLTIDDLPKVQALALMSEREGFRFVQRFVEEMPAIALDLSTQWFLGVFEDDKLCAIGGVTPDPYSDDVQTGRIRRVFVASTHRGRGVGSDLLDALETRASKVYTVLRLSTDTVAAAAFYEHRGYVKVVDAGATHMRVSTPALSGER